jgi:hypothetical protein
MILRRFEQGRALIIIAGFSDAGSQLVPTTSAIIINAVAGSKLASRTYADQRIKSSR